MPSSPGPHAFTRTPERFVYRGISLLPQDMLGPGKLAFCLNIRSYQEGTITPRYGLERLSVTPLAAPIHSLFRLNDTTLFAAAGADARIFLGAGTALYVANPGGPPFATFGGLVFSGDPLTALAASPVNSPQPWLYIADRTLLRKVNNDLQDAPIGLPTPTVPPTATLAAINTTYLDTVGSAAWTSYGGGTTPGAPTPAPTINRVSTIVTQLLYDVGATGMASVSCTSMAAIISGATLDIGAAPETVIVQDVYPAIAPTTIAAILYDVGNTGLCSIQPTGSFSLGQIEQALPDEVRRRYHNLMDPVAPRVTVSRTVDFPVNALILIGGVEVVRILSIAIGPDGVESFRCSTAGTFAATATLTGIPSFRAYFFTTKAAGDPAVALALQVTVTPPTTAATVGGVQTAISSITRDWGTIGGAITRASQPSDYIRFGIRFSTFAQVTAVRLMLDVDLGATPFLRNYYVYEWRANDLLLATQSGTADPTDPLADAQAAAILQGQVDAGYTAGYGSEYTGRLATPRGAGPLTGSNLPDLNFPRAGAYNDQGELSSRAWEYRARQRTRTDGVVTVGSGVTRQLTLGDNQWITLFCRIGDLTRIGTEPTLTLNAIRHAAIVVQIEGTVTPIVVNVTDCYLTGGYGPDVGLTLPPIVYRYRYRQVETGERSNPSPSMRAGVLPKRGRVALAATLGTFGDTVDWFRYGGALARWAYVGSSPNTGTPAFNDDMEDSQIEGGDSLSQDQYQPWPTYDLPRSGVCVCAGTSIQWVSGDVFNTTWAADSTILINGRATTLYRPPASTTRLEVVDNVGSNATADFQLPAATFLARALPAIWGGPINNAWFTFACGDPADPGLLHWSHGNNPDATSPANTLSVTSASEPLQNGYYDDGAVYVFSSDALYRIIPTFGDLSAFRAVPTQCTKGLWSRWAMAVIPDGGGVVFLAKDGIYYSAGGAEAESLIDPDLRPLFPQDGAEAEPIRNLNPVDMTATTKLKLTVVDGNVYFDYQDTEGEGHTLLYEPTYKRWTPDAYLGSSEDSPAGPVAITARLGQSGPEVHDDLMGASSGQLYQYSLDKTTDDDLDIDWAVWTRWVNADDPRIDKQWGDAVLDMHPGGSDGGIVVTPVVDNGNTALAPQTLGINGTVRATYLVEVGLAGQLGTGVYSRTFGLLIEGAVQLCDTQRPLLYLWEPAFLPKAVSMARRATDWEDLGYPGAKFIQGVVLRANTYGNAKSVAVQYDGPNAAPQTALTLSLLHTGERQIAYPLAAAGWSPFIAELVRLQGADDVAWSLLDWRFVWEPAPELASQWETQYTTFDFPGFLHVHDGIVAYQSSTPISWFIEYQDGGTATYTLASSVGLYRRIRQITEAQKGKAVRFRWTADSPFRLFKQDCSVRVQSWGAPGGYQIVSPFGGPSRADGAGI